MGSSTPFSSSFSIEKDLARLSDLDGTVHELKELSHLLKQIEEPVFASIQKRLEEYRGKHPSSPIFCAATLFGPIDYGRLETATTKALAWLMDPSQPHEFGSDIARRILSLVEPRRSVDHVTRVIPEKIVGKQVKDKHRKRMDIYAEGVWSDQNRWAMVIEAKIDAIESLEQLGHYEEAARDGREWIGIFLTPEGTSPHTEREAKWKVLSFRHLADDMLSYYLEQVEVANEKRAGADFLRLFIAGLLRDILELPVPVSSAQNNRFEIADFLKERGQ